jgi:hypothetical protein
LVRPGHEIERNDILSRTARTLINGTMPDKGWFLILRLYSPLEPFFAKTWRPSEIEPVK